MGATLQNSIWPNVGGTLGEIKTQIPDGVTIKWPEGDALVGNFVYKDGNLVGLVDTKALIENDSKTTVLPYDCVNITLDKRLESIMTFEKGERCKYFNINHEVMLPEGYKRLAYLESTGTQWIDTSIKLSDESDFKITCEFSTASEPDGNSHYAFGVGSASIACYAVLPTRYMPHFYLNNAYVAFGDVAQRCVTEYTNSYVILNGVKKIFSNAGETVTTTDNIAVFSCRNGTFPLIGRIYSFSISCAGEMQMDYVPALSPTGAPCMYDIMSGEPFYSETADDFIYPGMEQQVSTYSLRNRMYAKMTEHGVQRLYHVPKNYSGTKEDYAFEYGFKELVTSPMPTEGHWTSEWAETDTQLICNWVEIDLSKIE